MVPIRPPSGFGPRCFTLVTGSNKRLDTSTAASNRRKLTVYESVLVASSRHGGFRQALPISGDGAEAQRSNRCAGSGLLFGEPCCLLVASNGATIRDNWPSGGGGGLPCNTQARSGARPGSCCADRLLETQGAAMDYHPGVIGPAFFYSFGEIVPAESHLRKLPTDEERRNHQ